MKVTVRRVQLDSMGFEARGINKGRYWGVGLPLYYCPELETLRSETPIHYNEPHCRASDVNTAREIFARRMEALEPAPVRMKEG